MSRINRPNNKAKKQWFRELKNNNLPVFSWGMLGDTFKVSPSIDTLFNSNSLTKYFCKTGLVLFYIIFSVFSGISQDDSQINPERKKLIVNPIREETQRYIGYEDLIYRFTTLPYDITMNANVQGTFLDISFLFLMLLPILFFSAKIDILEKWLIGFLLTFILIVAIPINYCNAANIPIDRLPSFINEQLAFGKYEWWTFRFLTLKITLFLGNIFQPIHQFIAKFSGERDFITLPFLLLSFTWLLYLINKATLNKGKEFRGLLFFIVIYGFLWFYLSAGIVWYGLLFFPIIIAVILISVQKGHKFTRFLVIGISSVWLLLAMSYRLSNYLPINETFAKGIIDPFALKYQSGIIDKSTYLDEFFPKFSEASRIINQEDTSLIYMVNTMLPFFIKKSDQRVINDGQLSAFVTLARLFPKKESLAEALKIYNVKYVVLGLNTHAIDQTPEQSLATKYDRFLRFLENNNQLELIVTDRTVINESNTEIEGMFGKRIEKFGTFAMYEVIE